MEPLPQNGTFSHCAKHPSQLFTGVCSYCLMERLSSVNSAQPNPNLNTATTSSQSCEIEEIQSVAASPNAARNTKHRPPEVKMRKTLLLLFQLDDERENCALSESNGESISKEPQLDLSSNPAAISVSVDEAKLKGKGASFRLSSIVPKWRKREAIKANHSNLNKQAPLDQGESRHSFRYSFDLPRHSWDGSISKAMACPFACLDERKSRRKRGGMSEERQETMSGTLENGKTDTSVRVLERSLSESGKDSDRKLRRGFSRRFRHPVTRSNVVSSNGDLGLKIDPKPDNPLPADVRRKRELGFGRSRSVHYQSPSNLDNNGLLRFYLTPLRCRSTHKARRRNSRFFAGGLFGFL